MCGKCHTVVSRGRHTKIEQKLGARAAKSKLSGHVPASMSASYMDVVSESAFMAPQVRGSIPGTNVWFRLLLFAGVDVSWGGGRGWGITITSQN